MTQTQTTQATRTTRTTRTTDRRATRSRPADEGAAMVITLMVMALVGALATTVATVTISNLTASRQAQQAGVAVNAADAGLAQAVAYLRRNGVRGLACSPGCAANPWGNSSAPATVGLPGSNGASYRVWIEPLAAYPTHNPGRYRIHATGTAAASASRSVVADVSVATSDLPLGVFARTVHGGGSASVTRESIFSTGCVYNRSRIAMTGTDAAYGIPVAVHSSRIITDSNGSGQNCPTTAKPIHTAAQPCNPDYPYDQDSLGGPLGGTSCEAATTSYPAYYGSRNLDGDGTVDVDGSKIRTDAALLELFGIPDPALSQAHLDELRSTARTQGNYWTASTGWTSPDEQHAVMFFDLTGAGTGTGDRLVDLNDITGFGREENLTASSASCPDRSLVVVVEGGNARLNSNQRLAATLLLTSRAPYGEVVKANGTAEFIGTIYADTVNLVGTVDLSLDECFLANMSPALLDFDVAQYRELDR